MAGNPGGYFDPMQNANFAEPLVEATYHPYSMEMIPATARMFCLFLIT